MPIYDYYCEPCEHKFEEIVKSSEIKVSCPKCGNEAERQVNASAGFVVYGGYLNRYTSGKPHRYAPKTNT